MIKSINDIVIDYPQLQDAFNVFESKINNASVWIYNKYLTFDNIFQLEQFIKKYDTDIIVDYHNYTKNHLLRLPFNSKFTRNGETLRPCFIQGKVHRIHYNMMILMSTK